jgi:RHS repeat-associated protein
MAYAPFGEGYAGGQAYVQFTSYGNAWTVYDGEGSGGTLDDFTYRRYSPGQGRWISPDPAALSAVNPSNPQSWNRYAYVVNSPLTATDPLGLFQDAVTPSGDGNCAIDGQSVSCAAMQGLASEGGGGETGTVINGYLNAVAVRGAGWAFPSLGANNSLNWRVAHSSHLLA